jgi:hypothetical protein
MGEQRRALVQLVGIEFGDRTCYRAVRLRTPRGELRIVGDLLRQRMLEGVYRFREESLLVKELPLSQRAQPRRQLDRGKRATFSRIDCGKLLPITEAVCRSALSGSANRSIRAASTTCTVVGISTASIGRASR